MMADSQLVSSVCYSLPWLQSAAPQAYIIILYMHLSGMYHLLGWGAICNLSAI